MTKFKDTARVASGAGFRVKLVPDGGRSGAVRLVLALAARVSGGSGRSHASLFHWTPQPA